MDSFDCLPNELIYEMCKRLETPELLSMIETCSRIYQVCSDIVTERKKNQIIRKILELRTNKQIDFIKVVHNFQRDYKVKVSIAMRSKQFLIDQRFPFGFEVPWIMTSIRFKGRIYKSKHNGGKVERFILTNKNDTIVKELADNLINQHYITVGICKESQKYRL